MSDDITPGRIVWSDLTVPEPVALTAFYREVVGWESRAHDMGDYGDFDLLAPGDPVPVAGLCHARGVNADLPPQWLVYVIVPDVAASAACCRALGGAVVAGPRQMGDRPFCVIQDPAGAVLALIEA